MDVVENQAVLLKKVEELTPYIIEMQKQLQEHQQQIAKLKEELN